MTQRDGMGREVGGGFSMGNTCTPMADACWCRAKPIQYCKVKRKKDYWKEYQQPQICRWYHSNDRKWRGTKEPRDEDERGEWKSWLKLNIQEPKIMTSSPISPWQIEGEKGKAVTDFIFLGPKITADNDCSHETKRYLLLGRKAVTNLDSVLKSRDITLLKKVQYIQSYDFSSCHVWMW